MTKVIKELYKKYKFITILNNNPYQQHHRCKSAITLPPIQYLLLKYLHKEYPSPITSDHSSCLCWYVSNILRESNLYGQQLWGIANMGSVFFHVENQGMDNSDLACKSLTKLDLKFKNDKTKRKMFSRRRTP